MNDDEHERALDALQALADEPPCPRPFGEELGYWRQAIESARRRPPEDDPHHHRLIAELNHIARALLDIAEELGRL